MDCAAFERELTLLLGRDGPLAGTEERATALRQHGASCAACAGALDLVELAALPVAARDPIVDPDDAYWAGFERRLAERIDGTGRRATTGGRSAWLAGSAVAAVVVVGLLVWLGLSTFGGRGAASPVAPASAAIPAGAGLSQLSIDDDALALLDDGVGGDEDPPGVGAGLDAWGADPFPATEGLDAPTRRELLEWLNAQDS